MTIENVENKLREWFMGEGDCEQPTEEEFNLGIEECIKKKKAAKTSFEKEVYNIQIKLYKKEIKRIKMENKDIIDKN